LALVGIVAALVDKNASDLNADGKADGKGKKG
jgi:hypothetical protein